MWTLGIETSGRDGSIALLRDDDVVFSRSLSHQGRRHARTLVQEVKNVLDEERLRPGDCDVVAVSQGPGSFTGLRIGVVCAKTWAYATGCQLVGVDTLHAIAASAPSEVERVHVVSDAQRGDVFCGEYRRDEQGRWGPVGVMEIVTAEDWLTGLTPAHVVTGPALMVLADRILPQVQVLPENFWHPTAAAVARISRQRVQGGRTNSPWDLQPVYLRRSAAEEKTDSAAE